MQFKFHTISYQRQKKQENKFTSRLYTQHSHELKVKSLFTATRCGMKFNRLRHAKACNPRIGNRILSPGIQADAKVVTDCLDTLWLHVLLHLIPQDNYGG